MMKRKKPMRMCIGCREMYEKKTLLRVVKTPEDGIRVDKTGKMSGRGAYICNNKKCFEKVKKANLLEKHLSTKIEHDIYEQLEKEFEE